MQEFSWFLYTDFVITTLGHPCHDSCLSKLGDMQMRKELPHRLKKNGVSVFSGIVGCPPKLSIASLHFWVTYQAPRASWATGNPGSGTGNQSEVNNCRRTSTRRTPTSVSPQKPGVLPPSSDLPPLSLYFPMFYTHCKGHMRWFTELPTIWQDEINIHKELEGKMGTWT